MILLVSQVVPRGATQQGTPEPSLTLLCIGPAFSFLSFLLGIRASRARGRHWTRGARVSVLHLGLSVVTHIFSSLVGIVSAKLALTTGLVRLSWRNERPIFMCGTIPFRHIDLGCLGRIMLSAVGLVLRGLVAVRLMVSMVWRVLILAVLRGIISCPTLGSRWVGRVLAVRIRHFESRGASMFVGKRR